MMWHDGTMGYELGPWWFLVSAILMVWPFWRISRKAGYPGILGLLVVIPLLNIVLLYFLAFSKWPLERRAREGAECPEDGTNPVPPMPDPSTSPSDTYEPPSTPVVRRRR